MKITKNKLKQIIKEELENVLNEYSPPTRQQAAERKWGKKGYERARKAAAQGRQDEHLNEQELQEESAYYEMLSEGEVLEEAEYQGRKVTLNKPFRTPDGPKKSSVYVKNANRFQLRYVKQVEGIVCSGGICRLEPAFSGVKFSMSSNF